MSHKAASLNDLAQSMEALADTGLEAAKKLGAHAAKISTGVSFQKRLVVENKQFTLANSLESRSLSITVHKDHKKGSATLNSAEPKAVKQAVEDALALASYSVADEALTFASPKEAAAATQLPFMFDDAMTTMELEELQNSMEEILGRLIKDPRVALDRFEMSLNTSWHGLYNSLGVRQTERQTMADWSFFGMGRDGEEVSGFDYDGNFSFQKQGILPKALLDADRFVDKVVRNLHPRQAPSYKGLVLFSPRAVQELILSMLLYHASGRQVMDGRSKWDQSIGKKVISDKITLLDGPHDARFSGATSFDGDGLPTRPLTIIDRGVLKLHLHDCYSAKRTSQKSTGTAGGPFAIMLNAGETDLSQMAKAAPHILLVDRFSGNTDPVKGDFSGVAKSSRLLINGEDAGGVTETMIAGNFFELAQNIAAVSRQTEIPSGSFISPYVLADGVSVTGQA